MKKYLISVITLITIGCGTDTVSDLQNDVVEVSIEELNAHKGDPCDCINIKLAVIDAIQVDIDSGKYTASESLNEAINATLDGCMSSVNHKDADLAWANSLKGCDTFGSLVQGMATIHATLLNLKQSEAQKFVQDTDGASGVLDKLQESDY